MRGSTRDVPNRCAPTGGRACSSACGAGIGGSISGFRRALSGFGVLKAGAVFSIVTHHKDASSLRPDTSRATAIITDYLGGRRQRDCGADAVPNVHRYCETGAWEAGSKRVRSIDAHCRVVARQADSRRHLIDVAALILGLYRFAQGVSHSPDIVSAATSIEDRGTSA